ncbi:EamA family transporter [Streptomyces camelliae]|uniref:EamA family transporter n=1 Tax=Streptomyces camelliae TaxID=3004093 RepID=UPI003D16A3FA
MSDRRALPADERALTSTHALCTARIPTGSRTDTDLRRRAHSAGPAVWGSTYLVTTELLPPGRPLLASTMRSLPAGPVLLAIGRELPCGAWWLRALVLGALNTGIFFYLLFVAAYHLPGGVAPLVVAVQPTVVLLLGAALLKEPIRPAQLPACLS